MEYYIVGADGKEYGPVNEEDLRSWIDQGRAKETTLCRKGKDGDWKPLWKIINIGANFETPHPVQNTVQESNPEVVWDYITLRNQLLQRDAKISIGKYISKGWQLMNKRMGLLLGATIVAWLLVQVASVAAIVLYGPIMGGLYWIYLCVLRDQHTTFEDLFSGFSHSFKKLFLAFLYQVLLAIAVALPGLILAILGFALTYAQFDAANGDYNQTFPWFIGGGISFSLLIAILPLIVLSWLTLYALPIIMEYRLTAWEAVKLSAAIGRRQVFKGMVLMFVNAILASTGIVLLFLGVIFTAVWGQAVVLVAYDELFGNADPQ
ncbi:MAG: GYF domain-containing protein [Opitutae bacterium]